MAATVTVDFYALHRDKERVEREAAGALDDAVIDGAARLLARDTDATRALAVHLRRLPEHRKGTARRGNARQLCAAVRLFSEAVTAASSEHSGGVGMGIRSYDLRRLTRWALHPPCTASRAEFLDAQTRPSSKYKYELSVVTAEDVEAVALQLRDLVRDVEVADADGALVVAPAVYAVEDDDPDLLAPAQAALVDAVRDAKAAFALRRETLDAGAHGEWARVPLTLPACTFQRHALLLLEAEEHLRLPRGAHPSDDDVSLVELCCGVRMYAECVSRALWKMPLGSVDAYTRAVDLKEAVHWAAHAATWPRPRTEGSEPWPFITVNGAKLRAVAGLLKSSAAAACDLLDQFAEPSRRAVLGLAGRARNGDGKAALYLGLCLKDDVGGAAAREDGAGAIPASLRFYGAVCYPYEGWHQWRDAAEMLQLAETALQAQVAACTDAHALKELQNDHNVAIKELDYTRHRLEGTVQQPPPGRPRCSKEAAMLRLGVSLLGDLAPPTANQQKQAQ